MTEPYGHPPVSPQPSGIPGSWQDGIAQLQQVIADKVQATEARVVFITTQQVGRRPHDATGEYGGVQFAAAASLQFQSAGWDWLIVYLHEEHCFMAIYRPTMREILASH